MEHAFGIKMFGPIPNILFFGGIKSSEVSFKDFSFNNLSFVAMYPFFFLHATYVTMVERRQRDSVYD